MNECEMQIQLRQPAQAQPVLRSSGSSHTSTELNLSKQIQDSSSVTVAVQHLLESFDNSILRRTTTTCSNMSSEQARLAGIPSSLKTHQGALHHSSPSPTSSSVSSECNSPPTNGQGAAPLNGSGSLAKTGVNGGRLQFFKDGKFILELASSRENDNGRPGWVAVPRKIYWPPTAQGFTTYSAPSVSNSSSGAPITSGATNTNSNHSFQKNESSASLSFSDDNSSIQSSPWQRDHCWKQVTPRRCISRELCFVYVRPKRTVDLSDRGHKVSLAKRRRPYDVAHGLAIKDAFQRIVEAVESQQSPQDTESTTKRVLNDEKTDLRVNVDKKCDSGDVVIDSAVRDCENAENQSPVKAETDSVDGPVKEEQKPPAEVTHSNSSDSDSDKTVVKQEEMDVAPDDTSMPEDVEKENHKVSPVGSPPKKHELSRVPVRRRRSRRELEMIVTALAGHRKAVLAKLKLSSPKVDALVHSHMHQHVSPRKRILRELERVSLDEAGSVPGGAGSGITGKRPRPRGHQHNGGTHKGGGMTSSSSSTFFVPSAIVAGGQSNGSSKSGSIHNSNGVSRGLSGATASVSHAPANPAKPLSSYSIISLLGHNSSGNSNGHGNGHHTTTESSSDNAQHHHPRFGPSQQQQKHQMESVAAAKGMDLHQYNKSLPPKKKLSPPPPPQPTPTPTNSHHLRLRSPEMSPEHSGRTSTNSSSSNYKPHFGGGTGASFHPYLNVSSRISPSDDVASSPSSSRHHHHHCSSPQFARDRHPSSSSPVHQSNGGKNQSVAHGAASPYSSSSRPSPVAAATSPLSSSHFAQTRGHRRSPSPQERRANDRELRTSSDRNSERESELNAIALQQHQVQLEFERYASRFYGQSPHGILPGGPPPPHLMLPGAPSAALMSSLHQAAYLMYPPLGAGSGPSVGSAPYMPGGSSAYYQQCMAAAAAMYGRGSPLWPYMASGGIPGPPGSPLGPSAGSRLSAGLHHSPQIAHHGLSAAEENRLGSGLADHPERMAPDSPLALRMRDRDISMDTNRDDSDVPLNLSKH